MSTDASFNSLRSKRAVLEIGMDEIKVLKPGGPHNAIGTRNLNGCTVIVVIGTGREDAIVMAHIGPRAQPGTSSGSSSAGSPTQSRAAVPVTAGEKHFMKYLRSVLNAVLSKQSANRSLFSLPVAWGVFGRFDEDIPLEHLRELADQAFNNIGIRMGYSTYEVLPVGDARTPGKGTAFAIRHESSGPELYVEDKLVYPKDNTGALALEMSRLGISSQESEEEEEGADKDEDDHDDEDDDEDDNEEGDAEGHFLWKLEGKQYVCYRQGSVVRKQIESPLQVNVVDAKNSQVLYNDGKRTIRSRLEGQVLWKLEEGQYVCYQSGFVTHTQSSMPIKVNVIDLDKSRVLHHDGKQGNINNLVGPVLWKLEGTQYICYQSDFVIDRQMRTPLNVQVVDAKNGQVLHNDGKRTITSKLEGQVLWKLEEGKYVCYQSGFVTHTQSSMPMKVNVVDVENSRVLHHDGKQGNINNLVGPVLWKLEGTQYICYQSDFVIDRQMRTPLNVQVVDAKNRQVIYNDGKTLIRSKTQGVLLWKVETISQEDDDDDGDDDEGDNENDDSDDDDSLQQYVCYQSGFVVHRTMHMPLNVQIVDQSNCQILYNDSKKINTSRLEGQVLWKLEGGQYVCFQSGFVIERQTRIPLNVYVADTQNNQVLYYDGKSTKTRRLQSK